MTCVEEMAAFVARVSYEDMSQEARGQLKIRVLDTLGCAIGALEGTPVKAVREVVEEFGGDGPCTLVGGRQTAPDRAALYNGALVRYLDFMDNYMGKEQSGHPCDNFSTVLAGSEYAGRSGREFMAALALAYQMEIRLLDLIPVEEKHFDHTVQLAYSMSAGLCKALGMDEKQTANALAICGTAYQGLVVTRSGYLSQWKGLASANLAGNVVSAVFLARRGVTGPLQVMEGKTGLMAAMGHKFEVDWAKEDLEGVTRTSVKEYNSEVHSQSTVEGVLELKREHHLEPGQVDSIEIELFKQAFNIIGAGEEAGDKHNVHSKEQADHSLPYVVAVAICDGEVTPRQYLPERIEREDVQHLLKKVKVRLHKPLGKVEVPILDTYTQRYPGAMPTHISIKLHDGRTLTREKEDYEGFYKRPMPWERVVQKFEALSLPYTSAELRRGLVDAVEHLEDIQVADLTRLLSEVRVTA